MSRAAAWIADYPDGDNFMQLLYGPNTGAEQLRLRKIPEYDALYARTTKMPPGPERDKLYQEMTRIIEAYAPWRLDHQPLPQPADPAAGARVTRNTRSCTRSGSISTCAGTRSSLRTR